MRTARWKSRRTPRLVMHDCGYFWVTRTKAKMNQRLTCPSCNGKAYLSDILLVKKNGS